MKKFLLLSFLMVVLAGIASYAQRLKDDGLANVPHTEYFKHKPANLNALYPPVTLVTSNTVVGGSAGAPVTIRTVERVTDPNTGFITETVSLTIPQGSLPPGVTIERSVVYVGMLAFGDVPFEEEISHAEEMVPGQYYTSYTFTYDPNKYYSRTYGFDINYSNDTSEASNIYEYYERQY